MKQVSLAAFVVCVLAACNTSTTSTSTKDSTNTDTTASTENVTYTYPVAYSSDFTIGDPKYAQIVMELWKDYDDNAFERHSDAFADSVKIDFADGTTFNGKKDSLLAATKSYRSSLKSVVSSVGVLTTLQPKGKDETWVCVWGKEIDTHSNNKVDSVYQNENWMFNKDGKITYMTQFQQAAAIPKKN